MNDLESIKRINDAHAQKVRARDAKVEKVRAGHRRASDLATSPLVERTRKGGAAK